jgi:hypothetical protein
MNWIKAKVVLTFLNLRELLIALDQMANVLVCTIGFQQSWSDETMSAHIWRLYRDGKFWGRVLLPIADWIFSWQKVDPHFVDDKGNVVTSHCHRAYLKERERDYLPPEYRS